ncbi:MAG: hypothetical protein KAY59_02475, partial [Acidobacteria bacterium]|nr:hypothetical protein [Acidobacteriota bacterium]
YPVEWFAEVFAFMSLIENDAAVRADYAARARTLLMHVIDKAALGQGPQGTPYREREFSTSDRSLFFGESFALTVDWIYATLTPADKAKIRTTFLRWINENLVATTSGLDHPEPVWTVNSPALLADPKRVRNAINNFYNAHMNQIGLMSMALDPADDVGALDSYGKGVTDYTANAIGAWLYVHHQMMSTLSAGGVPPEGLAYGPTGLGRTAEFMLALYTAGYTDTAQWGEQVRMDLPYWDSVIEGHLHSASPDKSITSPDEAYRGTVYRIADHGDTYFIDLHGLTTLMATMGLHAQYTGNTARLNAIRWMELNMPAGGAAKLVERARDANFVRDCLLTFLLFDPAAPAPTDPRPALATSYLAPGIGRILARTNWSTTASWFTYHLSWNSIDHQFTDGNGFEFYRKGMWLTKQWAGYGSTVGGSDYKNTLVLENSVQTATGVSFWTQNQQHGSQYAYGPGGDPQLLAHSLATAYTYALGDATNLYNNIAGHSTDILEATRSILWIKPDTIVIYDRARSATAGRYKKFMLMLPSVPSIAGRRVVSLIGSGGSQQQLVLDSLLPAAVSMNVDAQIPNENGYNESATYEPMIRRLAISASGAPASTRFLNVVQGLDATSTPVVPVLIQSTSGTAFEGAEVGTDAIVMPVDLSAAFSGTTFMTSTQVSRVFVTGLVPAQRYNVVLAPSGGQWQVSVSASAGGAYLADGGGVVMTSGVSLPVFTDDPLVAGATAVKAVHLTELRSYITTVRARYGLSAPAWTDTSPTAGGTLIKAAHVIELRAALADAYVAAGMAPPSYAHATLTSGGSAVTALDLAELRAAILSIW